MQNSWRSFGRFVDAPAESNIGRRTSDLGGGLDLIARPPACGLSHRQLDSACRTIGGQPPYPNTIQTPPAATAGDEAPWFPNVVVRLRFKQVDGMAPRFIVSGQSAIFAAEIECRRGMK